MTHLNASLVNRGDDCRHVFHETIWVDSPFAKHAWRLAHQDWTYFARWYRYYTPAKALREAGGAPAEEDAIRDRVFGPLSAVSMRTFGSLVNSLSGACSSRARPL